MIVTCNKCSTSFNLDDVLIKEDGTKVRCSVCKTVFTAYPMSREKEQTPEESPGLGLVSDLDDSDTLEEASDFEMEDNDFSFNDSDLSIEDSDMEIEDNGLDLEESDLDVDDDFSFEENEFEIDEDGDSQDLELEESPLEFDEDGDSQDLELEEGSLGFEDDGIEFDVFSEDELDGIEFETMEDDEPDSFDIEDSELSLEMNDEPDFMDTDSPTEEVSLEGSSMEEEEFELEFDIEDDSDIEVTDIEEEIDETSLEIESEPDDEDVSLSLEDSSEENVPPVITPEDDFSEYDDILEQETEPEDAALEEKTIETEIHGKEETALLAERSDPLIDASPRSRRRKKKSLVGAPVLVLILIAFLVVGAYIASIMTGYKIPYLSDIKIPFIEQYLKKPVLESSEAKPVPNQKSVNGRFVTNSTAGTIFVITGRVENPSNIIYSHIEIRGALITKGKVEAKIKNAFCGNIITEEMLKTGNISDINKLVAVKSGTHDSNINIKPGTSVPFMVVFSDLPVELQNFTVKVIGFEKAKNN